MFALDTDTKKKMTTSENSPRRKRRALEDFSQVMREADVCENPLAAYAPKPAGLHFESQAETERVVMLLRRHPITNIRWILTAVVLSLAPQTLQFVPFLNFFPDQFQTFTVLGWYMLIFAYALENFLSWFFQVNIITDERIIDIDFYSLIFKKVSSAKLDNIEDITSSTGGFLRSLMNYGTVIVQTAATQQEFEFIDVPQPDKVIKLLNELLLEEEQEKLEGRAY